MTGRPIPRIVLASLALLLVLPAAALAGGPILSNQVVDAFDGTSPYLESWTFAGNAGDRVVMTAVSNTASSNTVLTLRDPNGVAVATSGGADRLEFQLTQAGTWTVDVSEQGNNYPLLYKFSVVNLATGPFSDAADLDGGAIASAENRAGSMQLAADLDAYSFVADAGDRVILSAVSQTAGFDTRVSIYPPGGGAPLSATTTDRLDVTLAESGTWTVLVEDDGNDATGSYAMSLYLLPDGPLTSAGDADGGALALGERRSGGHQVAADFDVFAFDVVTGRRYLVELSASLGDGSYQLATTRFEPGSAPAAVSGFLSTFVAGATGTAALLLEEVGLNNTGTYTLRVIDVDAEATPTLQDPDAGAIASAELRSGQIHTTADVDGYTFGGVAGERVRIQVRPGSLGANPRLTLVGPTGVVTFVNGSGLESQLASSGQYTLLVDNQLNYDTTWSYTLSLLNITSGPFERPGELDGGAIASAEYRAGAIDLVGDADAYQFDGTAGDRIALRVVPTGGAANQWVGVYPPAGGAALSAGTGNLRDFTLGASGTWTVIVEGTSAGPTGAYRLEVINLTSGPLSSALDPDGGAILSNVSREGTGGPDGDLDAYALTAAAGERLLILVQPHGTQSTAAVLKLLGPVSSETAAGTRLELRPTQTGTFYLLIDKPAASGSDGYSLSFVNLSAGPFDGPDDTGGAIVDGTVLAAVISARAELDAYRFTANASEPVVIDAVATSGSLDTRVSIYPPTGGPAVYAGVADHVEYVAPVSGTYTLLVEDATQTGTGEYQLSFDGGAGAVGVVEPAVTRLTLAAPYPNPFAGSARIECAIPSERHVRLRIYDARGAVIRTLADARFDAGPVGVSWDGRNDRGASVAAGLYFVEFHSESGTLRRKLVRME